MASNPYSDANNRATTATSALSDAANESVGREEEGSTENPASAAVRATEAPPIEAGLQADDDFDISSELGNDNATASAASSMLPADTIERGRRYASFGDVRYPMPINELEESREDMQHAMLLMLTQNKHFLSPVGDHPQKILDIGTGTGEH